MVIFLTERPTCNVQSTNPDSDLNVVEEGVAAKFTCTMRYAGPWGPTMELYDPSSDHLEANRYKGSSN